MKKLKILVVDDSSIINKKLIQIYESLGHKVVDTAKTGEEAIEKYDSNKIDLVSMDITMPDMDGIEATKKILDKNPEALVMVVTSHGQEQMIVSAIEAGAVGYILKPFNKERISAMIDKILGNIGD
ncbi:response regulator receiver protein [Flexistipes sinusarabici DSM 4947]|uniref:Response regulator receiver protein n=1 Tax=Flexistipes sinusarabici (strain ATCC 49648 / DSM 4947 / MAS 10) TaxID=717231 RepID=F8E630_FLESM|nr:response regulator [Flexistipes sinusarabici]AEI14738.1 response regulator receiver protein [Flexistipes sinusarabici DSM 4947]